MQIFDYHLWANKLVLKHLKELPGEVRFQEVQSVFPTIYDTIFHMYQVDYVWLRVLKGDSFDSIIQSVTRLQDEKLERSLEKLEQNYLQLSAEYRDFIDGHENLNAITTIHHPSYGTLKASYFELLQHVVNHGTYHRGNITAILRQQGYKGTQTDYVFYLYQIQK
ncbi:DinB family protein [Neobacillus sp. WH10]|uniref:DinB family protein n=1 Tax=Neobacillus sp. WH10 TaxID=3047873 RepID=UPI0024C1A96C|nr:DinB family protein [Neobacillus sp. WH10]WHY80064.1 DinB family protein [Neobacillus sp. WH10]